MSRALLNWIDPVARTDGTALPPEEIASTDIFDSNALDPSVPIGSVPGAATTFTTGVLAVGDHNFFVVVNDTTGHKSAPSNIATVTVVATQAAPNPATDLTATLIPDTDTPPTPPTP